MKSLHWKKKIQSQIKAKPPWKRKVLGAFAVRKCFINGSCGQDAALTLNTSLELEAYLFNDFTQPPPSLAYLLYACLIWLIGQCGWCYWSNVCSLRIFWGKFLQLYSLHLIIELLWSHVLVNKLMTKWYLFENWRPSHRSNWTRVGWSVDNLVSRFVVIYTRVVLIKLPCWWLTDYLVAKWRVPAVAVFTPIQCLVGLSECLHWLNLLLDTIPGGRYTSSSLDEVLGLTTSFTPLKFFPSLPSLSSAWWSWASRLAFWILSSHLGLLIWHPVFLFRYSLEIFCSQ